MKKRIKKVIEHFIQKDLNDYQEDLNLLSSSEKYRLFKSNILYVNSKIDDGDLCIIESINEAINAFIESVQYFTGIRYHVSKYTIHINDFMLFDLERAWTDFDFIQLPQGALTD